MKNISYNRTLTDKISVKGQLSADGTVITYDQDGDTKECAIAKYFEKFAGQKIVFNISTKTDTDLVDTLEDE